MRYLGAVALFLAAFFCVAIFAGPNAKAAGTPAPATDQFAATPGPLTQQSAGTWSTTVYVDTGAACASPSYYLVTTKPYSYTAAATPVYVYDTASGTQTTTTTLRCDPADIKKYPVTEAMLAFTPQPALPAVPQSASLVLTPAQAGLDAGVAPVDLPLTVRRAVPATQYVWIPVICGSALAVLLVGLTMLFGVPAPGGGTTHIHRQDFWRMPLYASSAWSFGDSWATNITALSTVVASVLAASGSIAEVIPGVELGRFGLLIALAGGITFIAPLLFGWLNYQFRIVDPATSGVAVIRLPRQPDTRRITIAVPASGTVTVHGAVPVPQGTIARGAGLDDARQPGAVPDGTVMNPDTSLGIPAGACITVRTRPPDADGAAADGAAADGADGAVAAGEPGDTTVPVIALPGTGDIVVTSGQLISVNARLTVRASDVTVAPAAASPGEPDANGPPRLGVAWLDHIVSRALPAAAPAKPATPLTIQENQAFEVPEGAKISFLGRAGLSLPEGAVIEAPVADPHTAARRATLSTARPFVIPRTGEAVAAQMWTMLVASCLTVFGIGAQIGILGWVLGWNLVVAPQWARDCCAGLALAAAAVVLLYGVCAIRALADTREGTSLSGPGNSSFML